MIFKGWQKESLIEWPGKICTVVFLSGCNFKCPFCYNRDLVLFPQKLPDVDEKDIFDFLKKRRDLLDGLMITGGEPTISFKIKNRKQNAENDIVEFIKKIKKIGLKVGIETNGSNPEAVEYLIKNKLIDYVAMDIKAPLEMRKYNQLSGVAVDLKKIEKSVRIIKNACLETEFRTTVVPGLLNKEDILKIARKLKGVKKYCLQNFRPENTLGEIKEKPYPQEWFQEVGEEIKKIINNIELRI